MTDRHDRTRRRNFSPRMHRLTGGGPDGHDRAHRTHAALTGWEHQE